MIPPLIPLPEMINVQTNPALLLQLTQAYREWLPQPPLVPVADPQPVLYEFLFERIGRAGGYPGSSVDYRPAGRVPMPITSYRDDDYSNLDSPFGVQVHHPRFLEWVGAPESTCLLGRPPAEWLQVMAWQDTLHTAFQLQHDANLLSSNLAVLHQYAISLYRTSTEVFHSMFGRVFFPSGAVNDAAPVPHVLRASVHMEASMGLWRPPVGPGGRGLDTVHQGPQCPGCPLCCPRPSGW